VGCQSKLSIERNDGRGNARFPLFRETVTHEASAVDFAISGRVGGVVYANSVALFFGGRIDRAKCEL
jgi:hypothetical protein